MSDATQTIQQPLPKPAGPVGIGGWLILPMLGLFGTVAVQLFGLTQLGSTFGSLSSLTSFQSNVIVIEFIANFAVFLVFPIVLLVMMFNRSRSFPKLYIWWQVIGAVLFVLDLIVVYAAFHEVFEANGTPFINGDDAKGFISVAVGLCIWVPYMISSVRVKNTFIH